MRPIDLDLLWNISKCGLRSILRKCFRVLLSTFGSKACECELYSLFLITFAEHCWLAGTSGSVHHKRFLRGTSDVFLTSAEKIQKTQEMNKTENYLNYFKGTVAPDKIGLKVVWLDRAWYLYESRMVKGFFFIWQSSCLMKFPSGTVQYIAEMLGVACNSRLPQAKVFILMTIGNFSGILSSFWTTIPK